MNTTIPVEIASVLLLVCQFCFEGFLVASRSHGQDARTTVHHFYLDRLLPFAAFHTKPVGTGKEKQA
ncbi:MAG: hypothetical protein KME23_25625 [Goleter apudmare HA4340-LM2]|nr:hypothetical protein [Goleter apudmare HA4340-LM2]